MDWSTSIVCILWNQILLKKCALLKENLNSDQNVHLQNKKRKKKTSLFSLSPNACQWLSTILEKSSSSIVPNSSWLGRPVHLVSGMAEEEKADLVIQYKWTSSGRAVFDFTNKTKGRCLKLEQVRHLFFCDECSEHLACSLLLINRTGMREASGRSWWLCKCT